MAFLSFEDLAVYKTAREFRNSMYKVASRLPNFERYALADQIRRAAVSLTNNLAEGHGRFHFPDQIKFILIARGSLEELIDDLNICSDQNYVSTEEVSRLKTTAWNVLRLINGYLRYLREQKPGSSLSLREDSLQYGNLSKPINQITTPTAATSSFN